MAGEDLVQGGIELLGPACLANLAVHQVHKLAVEVEHRVEVGRARPLGHHRLGLGDHVLLGVALLVDALDLLERVAGQVITGVDHLAVLGEVALAQGVEVGELRLLALDGGKALIMLSLAQVDLLNDPSLDRADDVLRWERTWASISSAGTCAASQVPSASLTALHV
jgi:hypothetical protein